MGFFLAASVALHGLVHAVFIVLWLVLIARVIVSWIGMRSGGNALTRFLDLVIGPLYDPIVKRAPNLSVGVFDISGTLAFFFLSWAFFVMDGLIQVALP